ESLWLGDHVAVPVSDQSAARERFYEAMTVLGYLAGVTSTIQLGTGVLIVPYRHPLLVASQLATADRLSGGRVIFGGASGWLEGEFQALDIPFRNRGARTDEYLQAIKHLWTTPRPHTFEGRYVQFEDIKYAPQLYKEADPPPVWIGGNSRAAATRAVKYGDAWFPLHITRERLAGRKAYLLEQCQQFGREKPPLIAMGSSAEFVERADAPQSYGFQGSAGQIVEELSAYSEAGLDYLVLDFPRASLKGLCATMEMFADKVIPALTG
ncbi:MAG: TIGR03619 family F420-dependent LLM class oxidoreductase, partial [Gammaproteobacteria bacterium]|nr:TIGR03619 family F420-dependent LLM class oxidoreductase [Gammaproteobacteria bacterium]